MSDSAPSLINPGNCKNVIRDDIVYRPCSSCRKELTLDNYSYRTPGRLHSRCKQCGYSDRKRYSLKASNRLRVKQQNKKQQAKNLQLFLRYLQVTGCVDCGEQRAVLLECDHLIDKEYNVGNKAKRLYWSTLQLELSKCVIRCGNCHRKRTTKQLGMWRGQSETVY